MDLEQLERVLRGEQMGMPFESIQALDVVLRHLPSMRCELCVCVWGGGGVRSE